MVCQVDPTKGGEPCTRTYRVFGRELLPGEDPADLLPGDEQVLARVDGDEGGVVRILRGESIKPSVKLMHRKSFELNEEAEIYLPQKEHDFHFPE